MAPAERRLVTVLFVDLVGYTALCAELDHEEVHLLVRPLMNGLRRLCEDLGGAVPAIEGDGFMAVFGGRHADPEDPARALVAAARMQALVRDRRTAYGRRMSGLRIGVHVGEVLTAPSWEQHGFSVSGDVVNVASRLCDAAAPGEVLGSVDVRVFVSGDVWGPELQLHVKNRPLEVRACALQWDHMSSAALAGRRPIIAPLIGRAPDLSRLGDALRNTAVGVFGDAGVGKSRLVDEWVTRSWIGDAARGSCSFFDSNGELAVVRELVQSLPDEAVLQSLPALPASQAEVIRVLRGGVGDAGSEHLQSMAAAALLRSAAAAHGLAVVVEDVQWASTSTLNLLKALLPQPLGMALVVTARGPLPPDLGPDVLAQQLLPMDPQWTTALVEELLPGPPPEVLQVLVDRSGGLPLFVEQCAQMLIEDGTVELTSDGCRLVAPQGLKRVPAVMRLFVGARLDLLASSERRVLMTAAVLGDRVDTSLLLNLLPDSGSDVEALVEKGLMRWEAAGSGEARPALRFSHALVRDVAYDRQLRKARAEIHCAAADWYGILPAREMLEARARHLRAAVEVSPPECSLAHDAVVAMTTWSESILVERPVEARPVLEEALALAQSMPECDLPLLRTHLALATVYELAGLEHLAAEHTGMAAPLAHEQGDAAARAQVALLDGRARALSDPEAAEGRLVEAEALFDEAGDRCGAARTAVERAILVEARQGLAPLVAAHEVAYRVGIQFGDNRLVAQSTQELAFLTTTLSGLTSRRWIELAASAMRSDDLVGRATLHCARGWLALESLELVEALQHASDARDAAGSSGTDYILRNATVQSLEIAVLLGQLDDAGRYLTELQAMALRRPNELLEMNCLLFGAQLAARQGGVAAAAELLRKAEAMSEASGPAYRRGQLAVAAHVALDRGRFEAAAQLAAEASRLDGNLGQPYVALRPRLVRLAADVAARRRVSLSEGVSFPRDAAEMGAPAIAAVARLWLALDETMLGVRDAFTAPDWLPDLPEARALVWENRALREQRPEWLLTAAEQWSALGSTVWQARALLWHSELTGVPDTEAVQILARLEAPEHLAEDLKEQVRRLAG